jgi:flagellar protein FliS
MDPESAYREAAVRGASQVRLVIFLYEQVIHDLQRAAVAMEHGDIELRTKEINHAVTVIGHLQGTLDRERGGRVGRDLERFYRMARTRLMEAQVLVSREILNQQISDLLSLREAWVEVDRMTLNSSSTPPSGARRDTETLATTTQATACDWTG